MSEGRRRLGLGLGVLAVVAAVLMMLPLPAIGGFSGHGAITPMGKAGALNEVGRAAPNRALSGAAATFGPVRTVEIVATPTVAAAPTGAGLTPAFVHPTSPQLLSGFTGADQATSGGYFPPDTQIAMNGTYVFELVNEELRITSTTGATVYYHATTQSFFGTNSTDNVGDVQIAFDLVGHHWFLSADDFTTNTVYIDVSKTSSPLGAYYGYFYVATIGTSTQFMDQPVMGFSATKVAWSSNQFNATSFLGSVIIVFDKHKLATGTLSYQTLVYSYPSVHPMREISTNGSGHDVLYMATTGSSSGSGTLTVIEAYGTIGSLVVSSVAYAIAFTSVVTGGTQPGTATLLANSDDRVQSVSWSSVGVLWVTFTAACIPAGDATYHSCIRVDAVSTLANVLDQDTNTAVAGVDLMYGALTAVGGGTGYLMILTGTGPAVFPEILVSGQNTSDPFATYRGPIPVFGGATYDTSGRWGDYSGIQFMQVGTKMTAWGANEYTTSSGGWGTQVVHFAFY